MRELNAAYDVLRDPQQRARYDGQRRRVANTPSSRARPMGSSSRSPHSTSSLQVVDRRSLATSAGRIRLLVIVTMMVASLALALWLFVEALMDLPWSIFLA
jgi:curved DNA-binding protein CbpA